MEFEKKDRHPDWIWYAGLIAVIISILSFFFNNIFFGIFAIIAGAAVILLALRDPKPLTVTINDDGIQINEDLFPYAVVRYFWLDETGKQDKLLLLVQKSFIPLIAITLEGVSAETIRVALKAKEIVEEPLRESSGVHIFERLGF
jgi:hypothetical protein